jgi:hypothetical protein
MINLIGELIEDWRRLDERIAGVSTEIEALAKQDAGCQRLMSIPGVGPIISSAVVAAIGNGAGFQAGARFRRLAWVDTEAGVDRGPHHPGQDIQARQQIRKDTIRAGRTRRSRAAAKDGKAGPMALDRAGLEAPSSQHAGNRARQ